MKLLITLEDVLQRLKGIVSKMVLDQKDIGRNRKTDTLKKEYRITIIRVLQKNWEGQWFP